MITKEQAYQKAFTAAEAENMYSIVIVKVSENASCWMFHYNSAAYMATREIGHRHAGNAPIIVDKTDGSLHTGGTRFEAEFYLQAYHQCEQKNLDYDEYVKTT
jgi:hypothetical protein